MLWKEGKFCIRTAAVLLLFAFCLNLGVHAAHRTILQQEIAQEVLRVHVVANSDRREDQQVKYLVRDAVLAWMQETGGRELRTETPGEKLQGGAAVQTDSDRREDQQVKYLVRDAVLAWMQETGGRELRTETPGEKLQGGAAVQTDAQTDAQTEVQAYLAAHLSDIEAIANGILSENGRSYQARASLARTYFPDRVYGECTVQAYLAAHLSDIEAIANGILSENGRSYQARASLARTYFPDRVYGECTFPAGWYDALRITLGKGAGQNWWGILYPELCFSDCRTYFPDRVYGECTFPAGWYDALRITLGKGAGQNWWGILYPELCFSDCIRGVTQEGDQVEDLKDVLSAQEYESLFRQPEKWKLSLWWFPLPFLSEQKKR